MTNNFIVACKINYYSKIENINKTDYAFVPADNLEDAGAVIDNYYGDDVNSIEMKFLDFPFVITSYEHVYNDIIREME